ncbi:MAG: hypothetical protein OIF50_10570 [Flavobacteriaceae bacterium]|nr:hypothetical protein [Flavobacteriaceae bacterium]
MKVKSIVSLSLSTVVLLCVTVVSCTQEELEQFIPTQPELLSPQNNEIDVNKTPHFSWEPSTDNDGDDSLITYDVYLWTNATTETIIAENLTLTSINAYPNNLISLATGETYFWKVVAEDQQGNEVSSATFTFTITEHPSLTFDGQTYTTIKIGNHRWLKQNLNSANHPIGISRCYNEQAENCNTYGRLYDWHAAMNIADQIPGWHLATDEEWKDLEKAIGMDPVEADQKGYRGTNQGPQLMIGGNSGFEARLAGETTIFNQGSNNPVSHSINELGTFWTATTGLSNLRAFTRTIMHDRTTVNRLDNKYKSYYYFSVRLVMD